MPKPIKPISYVGFDATETRAVACIKGGFSTISTTPEHLLHLVRLARVGQRLLQLASRSMGIEFYPMEPDYDPMVLAEKIPDDY